MKRRSFVKKIAAASALIEFAPAVSMAFASSSDKLRNDLQAASYDSAYWSRIQEEFILDPELMHFNTGSLGATPKSIIDAINGFEYELEKDPVGNMWGGDLGKKLEMVREKAAEFIGADTDEMMLVRNTTEAMNLVASSLDLKPGDEVLTSNHEHGGGMVCWQYLARHKGIKVKFVELPPRVESKEQLLQMISDQITEKTKVCSFMHIDTITGMILPFKEIAEITRPKNILLISDGAQAPGMLNVNVHELGIDAYASSSHKWMLAPKGCGLLYIRKEAMEKIRPIFAYSGYQVYSASSGTRDLPLILGHGMSMDFHNTIGKDKVEARCRQLNNILSQELDKIPSLKLLTPKDEYMRCGIVSYSIEGMKSIDVFNTLLSQKIRVKHAQGTYAFVEDKNVKPVDYNALRFSTHIINNEDQIGKLVYSMKKILG